MCLVVTVTVQMMIRMVIMRAPMRLRLRLLLTLFLLRLLRLLPRRLFLRRRPREVAAGLGLLDAGGFEQGGLCTAP